MSGYRPSRWFWTLAPLAGLAFLVVASAREQVGPQQATSPTISVADAGASIAVPQTRSDAAAPAAVVVAQTPQSATPVTPPAQGGDAATTEKAQPAAAPADKAKQSAAKEPYSWWASRRDGSIKIKGNMPSEEDKRTVLGMVKAIVPDLEIEDRMKVVEGAPRREIWLGAISFALKQLANLKSGTARLDDSAFSLQGEALTVVAYGAVKEALQGELPAGVSLSGNRVIPPVVKPFVWSANYEKGTLTLSGHVPGQEWRDAMLKQSARDFPQAIVVDQMELGAGPPKDMQNAIATALAQLARLQSGKIVITDTALTIEGVAADEATAQDIAKSVRNGLPAIYESKEAIAFPDETKDNGKRKAGWLPRSVTPARLAPEPSAVFRSASAETF